MQNSIFFIKFFSSFEKGPDQKINDSSAIIEIDSDDSGDEEPAIADVVMNPNTENGNLHEGDIAVPQNTHVETSAMVAPGQAVRRSKR